MKMTRKILIAALVVAISGATFAQTVTKPKSDELPDAPTADPKVSTVPNGPTAVIDTSMGRLTCQFYQQQTPKTVANFIALAEGTKDWTDPATGKKQHNKRFYDGTIFHRVIPEFMIQGGDPTGTGMGDPGYAFEDEFNPGLAFDRPGRLAMANSGPNTNGSQFFITEVNTEFLTGKHTIFGQCDDASVSVVLAIARVDRNPQDKPTTPVVINKVTIVRDGQPLPPVPVDSTPAASAKPATRPSLSDTLKK
jgi:peptidyl-prolyl cis-trans isomerase A (cyclophilin A)